MPASPRLAAPIALALGVALTILTPRPATAQFTLFERDAARLDLAGYVRTYTGVHDRGYDIPDNPFLPDNPRRSGFHGQVVRLKWRLAGEGWTVEAHDRVQVRVTSGAGEGPVLGFGVSVVPERLVDLDTDLVSEPGLRVWHDIDRLSVSFYTGAVDLTLGRQPITWGVSSIFPVADLWAQFSPFELDTEEKPGIDAVRALFYPVDGLEMDAVLAHRGDVENLSFGVRGTYGFASADVWAGAGKVWRELVATGGVTVLLEETKLRAEALLPWELDDDGFDDPRVTLGVDWIRGTLLLTGEYHYNGIGTDAGRYAEALTDPRVERGESYYLGKHYLGALASWSPDDENRLSLTLNALGNVQDPSVALTPLVGYDFGQAARLSLGALLSFGETPRLDTLPPELTSEFGAYGDLVFTRLSLYF